MPNHWAIKEPNVKDITLAFASYLRKTVMQKLTLPKDNTVPHSRNVGSSLLSNDNTALTIIFACIAVNKDTRPLIARPLDKGDPGLPLH